MEINVKRVNIPNEKVNRITQQAYGDADNYEPDIAIREPNWIGESELRDRVAKSLRELAALGFRLEDDRSDKPR